MDNNIILLSDSYKASHAKQYPKGTEYVYSYLESRGGKFDETVFFGLQYFIKEYLEGVVVTQEKINNARKIIDVHMGPGHFNEKGWAHILNEHGGVLPVIIRAVPEGTVVGTSNVLMTVQNTDPKCWWLTNFLETLLLQVWYPITVATTSRECKKLIKQSLRLTGDFKNQAELDASLDFKLVDFGCRGVSSMESAALGGAAHAISFKSSDTMPAIQLLQEYYNCTEMPIYSIPASEHSTITSWGKDSELAAFENMLDTYPTGPVACVSDSFDISEATDILWPALKEKILARDGVLIIRPDSGDIKMTLQVVLSNLWKHFGGTITSDGYKILDPHIRVIQGDGMNYESLKETLSYIQTIGFSTENVAFGMGGALLQKVDRDTQKFAFKCSAICIDGEWEGVYKAPTELDENGDKHASFKRSKQGFLSLVPTGNGYTTISNPVETLLPSCELEIVFHTGDLIGLTTFKDVKQRAQVV